MCIRDRHFDDHAWKSHGDLKAHCEQFGRHTWSRVKVIQRGHQPYGMTRHDPIWHNMIWFWCRNIWHDMISCWCQHTQHPQWNIDSRHRKLSGCCSKAVPTPDGGATQQYHRRTTCHNHYNIPLRTLQYHTKLCHTHQYQYQYHTELCHTMSC